MPSLQYYEAQTEIIDMLLEELAKITTEEQVNFNNTKQFDALLRHLESTLETSTFSSVPSENIIQVLFTLAARSPVSNWSHESVYSFAGNTTEYMKSINKEYDVALYKPTLQQRSSTILRKYLNILLSGDKSLPCQLLSKTIKGVLGAFYTGDIASFFSPKKAKLCFGSGDPLRSPVRLRRSPQKSNGNEISSPSAIPTAVEVISDSEESSSELTLDCSPRLIINYCSLDLPHKTVSSISDLSMQTSGLGETASLFHKPTQPSGIVSPDRDTLKKKKQKNLCASWKRIQIFDDHMIAKKLSSVSRYDIWNLLRWTFWCAETSSEYQQFLFNSNETHVHHIYEANRDFLSLFFGFCLAELRDKVQDNRIRSATIARILSILGPNKEWHEMAVVFLFSGLGIPSKDRPYPCYDRELLLTKNDPTVWNSRCKTLCDNDDDKDSMGLRVQILFLYMYYDLVQSVNASVSSSLMGHVIQKLSLLSLNYLKCFLSRFSSDMENEVETTSHTLVFGNNTQNTIIEICMGLISQMTNIILDIDPTHEQYVWQVVELVADENTYRSLVDDLTFKCMEHFYAQWEKLLFLLEKLFGTALQKLAVYYSDEDLNRVMRKARIADKLASDGYLEYVESRYEDSDLIPESSFTLTRVEIEKWVDRYTPSFTLMTQFKLGETNPGIIW